MIFQLNESPCILKKVAAADTPMQQFPPVCMYLHTNGQSILVLCKTKRERDRQVRENVMQ